LPVLIDSQLLGEYAVIRNWLLWTMLLAVTCGMVVGCSPDGGRPGAGQTTDEGKK
jgi:hypothetical protein